MFLEYNINVFGKSIVYFGCRRHLQPTDEHLIPFPGSRGSGCVYINCAALLGKLVNPSRSNVTYKEFKTKIMWKTKKKRYDATVIAAQPEADGIRVFEAEVARADSKSVARKKARAMERELKSKYANADVQILIIEATCPLCGYCYSTHDKDNYCVVRPGRPVGSSN